MKGGPSHVDTFDPKPLLQRDDGGDYPFEQPRIQFAKTGKLLKSPWKFKQHGQSGIPVSELFPNVAQCVDELCVIRSMHGTNPAHGGVPEAAHGQRHASAPEHGIVGHLRPGDEKCQPPRLHHYLPHPCPRRHEQLGRRTLPAYCQGTPIGNAAIPSSQAMVKHIHNTASISRRRKASSNCFRR